MNRSIWHEDLALDLACEAVGTHAPEESARLEQHIVGCTGCATELGELRDAAAVLANLPPPRKIESAASAEIRTRLLSRARADAAARPIGAAESPRPAPSFGRSARRAGAWSGWLVAAGLASLLVTHHGFHRPIAAGWVVAGILASILVGVAAYALRMRREIADLRGRSERPTR